MKRVALVVAVVGWVVGCGDDEKQYPTVAIGAVLDQSGSIAAPSWARSVELAVTHLNAGLKTEDAAFRLRAALADSTSNADTTVTRATQLVKDEGAKGLVLDLTRASLFVNKLNYDADSSKHLDVPQICIICTSTELNNPDIVKADPIEQSALRNEAGWQFRTSTKQDLIASVLLRTLLTAGPNSDGDVNGDGHLRLSFYLNNDNPGHDFRTQFVAQITAAVPTAEVEAVFVEPNVDVNTHDWSDDLTRLVDNQNDDAEALSTTDAYPDAILESVTAGFTVSLIKEYALAGSDVPFFHFHGFRHPLTALNLGSDINGQEGVSHVLLDNGVSGEVFADALLDATGVGPQYLDSAAYDSAILLGLAVIAAARDLDDPQSVTGDQVRQAMWTLQEGGTVNTGPAEMARAIRALQDGETIDYSGASSAVNFDQYGNALGKLGHYKGIGGKWEDLELYDCAQPGCPLLE